METIEIKRFWNKVRKTATCWEWAGSLNTFGYGHMHFQGKTLTAHRISWIIEKGSIPKGLFVLHHCDNRKCINPKHLFLGTQKDNMQDAKRKKRIFLFPKGEKHSHAKLAFKEVVEIRKLLGQISQNKIAEMFKVSTTLISAIKLNKIWQTN